MKTIHAERKRMRADWSIAENKLEESKINDPFLCQLFEILKHNFSNSSFGVQELANEIGFHQKTLNRRCNMILGKTTKEVIRQFRIQQSKKLLKENIKLLVIAYQCGFSDQAHFSRVFKKSVGLTPLDWLARNK
jgi:AraC-like DNA-binding protein